MCSSYLNALCPIKEIPYTLRDPKRLCQPTFNTITYGFRSLRYYGAHLWNLLNSEFKQEITLTDFKTLIKTWMGPKCSCKYCSACK